MKFFHFNSTKNGMWKGGFRRFFDVRTSYNTPLSPPSRGEYNEPISLNSPLEGGQGGVKSPAKYQYSIGIRQVCKLKNIIISILLLISPFTLNAQNFTGQNGADIQPDLLQFIRVKHESGRIPAMAFFSFFSNGMEPWAHDYPTAEYNIYDMIEKLTVIGVTHKTKILTLDSDEIFDYPILYICEIGYWNLREPLAKRLGEYLNRGGFLIVDDFRLPQEMDNLRRQLRKAVPNYTEKKLGHDHPIFNCFFEFPTLPLRTPYINYGLPIYYGLFDENGRLAAIINYNNDIGDGWELATTPNFSITSYKLGINYFIYSMTH